MSSFILNKENIRDNNLFLRFLAKQGVIDEYLSEIYHANLLSKGTNRCFYGRKEYPLVNYHQFVDMAFPWEFTGSGAPFWSQLHGSWLVYHESAIRKIKSAKK